VDIDGARVLITGASRGIGESLAREFAAGGASVALVARDGARLEALVDELGGTAHPTDLTDPALVGGLLDRTGPIDVLVNNAGLAGGGWLPDADPAEVAAMYQLNLVTPVQLTHAALPGMVERGRGRIVNVSSMAGVAGFPGMAVYASTKAGLSQFTETLALDLKGLPVGTTLVELGPIPTEMLDHVNDYQPTRDSFDRFYRLGLLTDVPRETVAREVLAAVRHDREHVRLPRRALPFALSTQTPRSVVRTVLFGVKHRA
jgi:short-subunit dehydrogenase